MQIKHGYINQTNGKSILDTIETTGVRKTLHSLIDLKNSIPRHDLTTFDIMKTDFAPENPLYVQGIVYSLALLVWFAFLMLLVFLIFVIGRYTLNKCDAQIDKEEGFVSE
jgi:hypothetical protein